jgi:hypothetical protein
MGVLLDVDPWQQEVIENKARIKLVVGGRGVGKTVGCARNMLLFAALSVVGSECAYFGPSYATAKRECRAMSRHRGLAPLVEEVSEQPFPMISWRTGSRTYFRSLDREDNVLGYHLNGAVVDEVHKIGERAVDEIVRPQVGAKRGWMLLIGQSDEDGEDGWLYKRFHLASKDPNNAGKVASWQVPSSMGRMYQGDDGIAELALIKSTTPDYIWRWQYGAEFVESQNKVFRRDDIDRCIDGNMVPIDRAAANKRYIIGYDIGRVIDPSAEVVLEVIDRERVNVVASSIRPLGQPHEQQAIHVAQLSRVFGEALVLVDATGSTGASGGGEKDAYERFYRKACPFARGFYFQAKAKMNAIQDLQLAVEQTKIKIPPQCDKLIDQLRKYRFQRKGSGTIEYAGPDGHNDDLVAALAMAYQGASRGWTRDANMSSLGAMV